MVRLPHVQRPTVAARRLVARRPWVYWCLVAVTAAGLAASVLDRLDRVDAARDAWGESRMVWVAVTPADAGQPIHAERRAVPAAVVPAAVADQADGTVARQRVGAGEIVTAADVAVSDRPQALVPDGWLAVPVVESPRSGAQVGDRVHVASDGFVVTADAIVVATLDDVTLLAVPADVAAAVPAAAEAGSLTLLLTP